MTNNIEALRHELARLRGLGEAYYDHRGELHYFSVEARDGILQAMGIAIDDAVELQRQIDNASQLATQPSALASNHAIEHCFQPAVLENKKCWGVSVQLYSLRSSTNWGMGDFSDLRQLIELAAPLGCDVVGLNPLHALLPADPSHISPYSPSSRLFLNPLYICVPEVNGFGASVALQQWFKQSQTQAEIAALRDGTRVNYERVAALKWHALRLLHQEFLTHHVKLATSQAQAFNNYVREGGNALRLHALFDSLDAHFRRASQFHGWSEWPEQFRDPQSQAVKIFAATHPDEVNYHLYLQWLANQQLSAAQKFAREKGMQLGLYGDLAVGANRSGSEVWSNQSLYAMDASIGAPPDPLALNGQDWGIPPIDPGALRAQKIVPFAELLRANMQHVGALRIDHVMSLFRLWWVPRGFGAAAGVYVHYPLNDLVLALREQSERAHCLVIGEDLGTVPDEVRDAMAHNLLYHYNVLLFEKRGDSSFKSPAEYPRHGIATATTHDLPPLKAWWQSTDIELRDSLNVYPHADTAQQLRRERDDDRRALLRALDGADLWHWRDDQPLPEFSSALARAIHLFLGYSNAALVLVQLEDLLGMSDPVNVPGTHSEHANWQRKLSETTQDMFKRIEVRESLNALTKARSGIDPNI